MLKGVNNMREILFRGKRIDNGEWVLSGNIIHFNDENTEKLYYIPKANSENVCIHDNNDNILSIEKGTFYRVIPETIGQYTGLTDKNGTKVFEGDILKGRFYGFPVIKDDFVFSVSWQDDVKGFKSNYFEANLCEVIGNIHDNPELLRI